MKRIFAAVLALCLCAAGAAMAQESEDGWAAGDAVVFGSYEQDNVLTNGKEPVSYTHLGGHPHAAPGGPAGAARYRAQPSHGRG